jgi:hypothetical protein
MSKRNAFVLSTVLLCGLLVAGVAWAMFSASYAINWDVIGGGGGPMNSPSHALNGTVGQAAIGTSSSTSYELGAGYWYGMVAAATPTATPTATSTTTPTATPTGTVTPSAHLIYLPIVLKNY